MSPVNKPNGPLEQPALRGAHHTRPTLTLSIFEKIMNQEGNIINFKEIERHAQGNFLMRQNINF